MSNEPKVESNKQRNEIPVRLLEFNAGNHIDFVGGMSGVSQIRAMHQENRAIISITYLVWMRHHRVDIKTPREEQTKYIHETLCRWEPA